MTEVTEVALFFPIYSCVFSVYLFGFVMVYCLDPPYGKEVCDQVWVLEPATVPEANCPTNIYVACEVVS